MPIIINSPKILIEGFQISNPKQILIPFFLIMDKAQQIIQCFMQSSSFWIKRMIHLFTTFPCTSKVQVNNKNVFKCLSVGEEAELEVALNRSSVWSNCIVTRDPRPALHKFYWSLSSANLALTIGWLDYCITGSNNKLFWFELNKCSWLICAWQFLLDILMKEVVSNVNQ